MRKVLRTRRRVVVAVVAALAVAGIGASAASAATPPIDDWTSTGPYADFFREMVKGPPQDFEPRDMKVGAPSSVISATGSDSAALRAQEVNNWRPNSQAWIDAKNRTAVPTGMTAENWEKETLKAGRWAPRVAKWIGTGGALALAADIGFTLADDVLYPALRMPDTAAEDAFCVRRGNFVTDALGSLLRNLDCAQWRLAKDYTSLVGADGYQQIGVFYGVQYAGTTYHSGFDVTLYCYYGISPVGTGYQIGVIGKSGGFNAFIRHAPSTFGNICFNEFQQPGWERESTQAVNADDYGPVTVRRSNETGEVLESSEWEVKPELAEWITRVRCLDGSIRTSVSESFQQQALGGVAVPAEVALNGCEPVGVDVGLQTAGTGTSGAGGGWDSTPGGTRTQVGSGEVPTEVQDWMRNFPSCWDGSCVLTLKKNVGTGEIDCFDVPDQCADWFEEAKTQPSMYKCYYAGQAVPLEECNVYSRVFDRARVQQGTGYADPKTGEETKTGTGTTTTTNPGAAKVAMETPVGDPGGTRECWPTGWGIFNPFEWVLQPVKCALEWAFVPRTSKLTETATKVQLAATNSQVGRATEVANTWAAVAAGMNPSGCAGPTINLNLMGIQYSGQPLSACSEPGATLAFWCRIIIGIAAVLAAVFAVTRYIGRVFGFDGFGRAPGGDT